MKFNHSTEQAAFVILMLALQKGRTPVRSSILAQALKVSDSYLKKILKHMVNAGLVSAAAGRDGGYTLNRPVTEITYGDIFEALEPIEQPTMIEALAEAIYTPSAHRTDAINLVHDSHKKAGEAYFAELKKLKLVDLMLPEAIDNGIIDWTATA